MAGIDPMTGLPWGDGASAAPSSTGPSVEPQPDDPEAQGLPAHVKLPEVYAFKRDQLRARLFVSLVVLALLGLLTWFSETYRMLYGVCTAAAAIAVVVLIVRYLLARSDAKKYTPTH